MHSKKTGFAKSFKTSFKRFFRARNIIIISEHKVDHVPLSGVMQVLLLVGTLGLFSGVSYITGSYMTARHSLREKDRKIVSTTLEKVRIGEEMNLLKHDLVRLSQNSRELSDYNRFIVDSDVKADTHGLGAASPAPQILAQDSVGLSDRVAYLEQRVREVQDENDHLVIAVRERTDKKISEFEDIISMTGLHSDALEHMAAIGENKPGSNTDGNETSSALPPPAAIETTKKGAHGEDEGGPFIPYDASSLNENDRDIIANVDRMILLHDIIKQLPLSTPIENAQTTGPFGRRVDPFNGRWAIHPGVDLAGPVGSKIYSTSAGIVVSAGHRAAYGNMVDIDHGFGIVTRYGHLSRILVKEGEMVRKGQQVGIQGSTGRSTGPHLHYEVRINDRPVNPVKFLNAGEHVSEN
jgi:murein DD-endopeptidase MepM/ murein hydrolase activator NlpD